MLNQTILLKVRQRLNKLDSQDYDNIEDWKIVEAFNKGQVDWCRRNLHGLNIVKEGDEQSTRRIDDLQILLETVDLNMTNRQSFYEGNLPLNYLQWKRVSCKASDPCCPKPRPMVIYLAEVANVDELLRDKNKKPSFEWAETFVTMQTDKLQIYTNGEFAIVDPKLTYYRQPVRIEIAGVQDPYTLTTPAVDTISEFKDDLVELFVDECAKIIAGDIESMNQVQRQSQATESNN
jgi:hypothetical protein